MKFYTFDELGIIPDVQFIVDGWIAERDICFLWGASEIGKSFVTTDLGHSIATGRPWCGRKVEQGPVLYAAVEGASGIPKRAHAWAQRNEKPDHIRYLLTAIAFGDGGASIDELIATCEAEFSPVLIIVDTVFAAMPGGNDSSAQDINVMLEGARKVRDTVGCAVLLIDHPGHEGTRMRGSGAKFQAAEVVIKAQRTAHFKLQLVQEKNRNFAKSDPISVRLEHELQSLVAVHDPNFQAVRPDLNDAEKALLDVLKNGKLRSGVIRKESGVSGGSFDRALGSLRTQGYVVQDGLEYRATPYGLSVLDSPPESHTKGTPHHTNGASPRSHTTTSSSLELVCGVMGPESEEVNEELEFAAYARNHPEVTRDD